MHYVYVIRSEVDQQIYTGCTNNLKQRLSLHNAGRVTSTKLRKPFELIYYEAYKNQSDAYAREKYYKSGWGRAHIKKILSHELSS